MQGKRYRKVECYKNSRAQEKQETNKEISPCCNKFVKTGVQCGQNDNWFH